jgi:sulfite exporter TauE/SafE
MMEAQAQEGGTIYDAQAVRVESSWGNSFLVRGTDGVVVGKIGGRGGINLATALARSPEAARQAAEYKSKHTRGSTFLAIGLVTWGIGAGVARMNDVDVAVAIPAWTAVAAGTFLMAYGAVQLNKASTAMARAIWWYNRDLGR